VRSSPGAFGFYPFIDRTNNYYGVLSTLGSAGGISANIVYSVKEDIMAALGGVNPSPSMGPTTSPIIDMNVPSNGTPEKTSAIQVYFALWITLVVIAT